jgi:CHAT domain-containing protein
MWAVSLGFLIRIAGSRRIVASNWLVDDEAAASLMSVYCRHVAVGDTNGSADYATALHKAKKWVPAQDKWASPFCWGALVLIGPN